MACHVAQSIILPCGLVIPNRLCKAAMTEALADEAGRATDKLARLYERWSQGGAGLLITGNIQVDRRYVERPGNVCIDGPQDGEQLAKLRQWTEAGKKHGSVMFAQISHAGRQSNGMINLNPVGPGNIALELPRAYFGTPRALTTEDIEDIKHRFVEAARVCQSCGFDGIQLHSAHGYLLSSFLNPRANNRPDIFGSDDKYGGSIENRSRLLLEIFCAVRNAVGDKFPISVKLNSADFQEGGFTASEAAEVARMLEEAGVDLLEISGGNYEAGIYEQTVKHADSKRESTVRREAYFLSYALEIKAKLRVTPVMVTGGWRSVANMDEAVRMKECSLIGFGRPLCGDPDGPRKILSGEILELPRYEQELQTFHWWMQWIFFLPIKLLHVINMMSQQGWYYRCIVAIAETGEPTHNLGCFASFLANMKHEQHLAENLQGDVQCKGSVYKGPKI